MSRISRLTITVALGLGLAVCCKHKDFEVDPNFQEEGGAAATGGSSGSGTGGGGGTATCTMTAAQTANVCGQCMEDHCCEEYRACNTEDCTREFVELQDCVFHRLDDGEAFSAALVLLCSRESARNGTTLTQPMQTLVDICWAPGQPCAHPCMGEPDPATGGSAGAGGSAM
jgi:outer membrane lipoprotein SlyB